MAEAKKDLWWQIIPRLNEDGKREPVWRQSVLGYQRDSETRSGQYIKPESHWLNPDGLGQYVLKGNHPRYSECVAAMKAKMESENIPGQTPRIVGPFTSRSDALEKFHEHREKAPDEVLAIERSKHDAEKSALQQRIAELESKLNK